ncbi:hypothetical protein HK22_03425 [Gluconobacter sp. DsW_056]|uniref:Uncharacterized protein n=1 Tax=Gluconobacter albidus TaxID=318683 RepID=A0A149TKJ7_9PROT|nr:hypothetical protein AD945_05845 [Gluconobacter albidus]OUI81142.1 hypothetical protein HK22_03425 [Gluconobacter sp. DsW_056]
MPHILLCFHETAPWLKGRAVQIKRPAYFYLNSMNFPFRPSVMLRNIPTRIRNIPANRVIFILYYIFYFINYVLIATFAMQISKYDVA